MHDRQSVGNYVDWTDAEYSVPCAECPRDVNVGAGTFARVIAKESVVLCRACLSRHRLGNPPGGQGGGTPPWDAQPPRNAA